MYTPPTLTVDCVVFQLIDDQLAVLLIKRQQAPFAGAYALPGGYNPAGETTSDALQRILLAKAGVKTTELKLIEQLYTFDTVARDPRGHAVSVSYLGLGKDIKPALSNSTQSPAFYPLHALPPLVFDHNAIIHYALERLRAKIGYTNAIYGLLDPQFTLTQLQTAYEAVLGRPLDRRNFRKKFLSLGLIEATNTYFKDGAHRPAMLYRFSATELVSLTKSFD